MNTYQGEGTPQGKIIPIKRRFASLVFGIIAPLFSRLQTLSLEISHLRECSYNLGFSLPEVCIMTK